MKISKCVLQAVAVAVIVSAVASCSTDDGVNPEKEKSGKVKNSDPCPACGMG
jgi:hypothetical protein